MKGLDENMLIYVLITFISIILIAGFIIIIIELRKQKRHHKKNYGKCLEGCTNEASSNCGKDFGCPKGKCLPTCVTRPKDIGKKGHCQYDFHNGISDCSKCGCI